MSAERFDRIESQISELREIIQQNMLATQQNMNALREDIISLRQRVDSIEGTVTVVIRDGLESMRTYLDDLNYDLSNNERKTRRLSRRVSRLEKDNDR
jgi:predicted  nucleic acid-binding Zn-ribbon protein